MNERPCSATEAVLRARLLLAAKTGQYVLGTGDYRPWTDEAGNVTDWPWTSRGTMTGSDCAGFAISWCYKLRRHRPGFNKGHWATVADDLNCNSAIEDGRHNRELFEEVLTPFPGALLLYPTIYLAGRSPFIGHVGIVSGVDRCLEWDVDAPDFTLLDVIHCCGPNGRKPAVVKSDGAIWQHHSHLWPKPEHKSVLLRALP